MPSRFDITTLRKLAGDKVFERGKAYHAHEQVEILSLEPQRVLAQVAGSDDYRVVLTGRGKKIGGECSCPAFTDWGFCKHMVATALAADEEPAEAGDSATALGRIQAHLKNKGIDGLVDMVLEMAERDPALWRKLDMASATVEDDDTSLMKRLQRAIDGATRTRDFVEYRAAAGWADGVASVLDSIARLAAGKQAGVALKLAEHAIDRVERAIESIDDSDGHCGALLEQARDIHLAACRAVRPDPVSLARVLFGREKDGEYDTFYRAAEIYDDVLGKAGLAEYRRLARDAWKKLPPRTKVYESAEKRGQLEDMLDFFAEREGNVEERIALRSGDLASPLDYLRLAEFCLAQGRKDEALRRAEEGLWKFEDDKPDERLVLFTAGLLTKAGRKVEAERHLWRAFEQAPSDELYARLRKLGGIAARDRALTLLDARQSTDHDVVDLLVQTLIKEKLFDAAWSAMERGGGCGAQLRHELAEATRATHPGKALLVYGDLVEQQVKFGRYEEAAKLIRRMASLRSAAKQTIYLADLKDRHRRKRNFMKLL